MKNVLMKKTESRFVKRYWKKAAVCVFALLFLLTACGGTSRNSSSAAETEAGGYAAPVEEYKSVNAESFSIDSAAAEEEAYYEDAAEAPAVAGGNGIEDSKGSDSGGSESTDTQSSNRKIIYTGNISLQTLEYEKSAESIHGKISKYGGFIEAEDTSNDNPYWYYSDRTEAASYKNRRYMNVTARIPADKFDSFLDDLKKDGQVISSSVNARNISVQYANHDASRKALEIEQDRLLKMMEKAETVEDMIAVEQRLTEVERELNDEKTQLSDMDRDVNFSTVYISLQEVIEYSEQVVEVTYGEKLKKAFNRAIEGFLEFWEDLILVIVETFPFLIMFGLIIFAVVKLSSRARRRRKEKLEKMQKAQGESLYAGGAGMYGVPTAKKHSFFRRHEKNQRNNMPIQPNQSNQGVPVQPNQSNQGTPVQPNQGTSEQSEEVKR